MPESTSTRTRSFGGCGTCRSRHMKCDEARPKCSTCIAYGLDCDGYTRNIFFDVGDDEGPTRYRQLLFSDDERKQMNLLMTKEVPFSKTHRTIAAIDQECEVSAITSEPAWSVRRGPFGAFKLLVGSGIDQYHAGPKALVRIPSPSLSDINFMDPSTFQLPDWLEASSLFDFDACAMSPFNTNNHVDIQEDLGSPTTSIGDSFDRWLTSPSASTPCNPSALEHAPFLLKHYAENIISSLTPFRHTKTPWHVLFLPNAKTTLASLAMGDLVDDANMTTFHGILAISALSIHNSSLANKWHLNASEFGAKAQKHLKIVLRHALDRPKIFKYKSILMAIITMIQVSMIDGSWEQTDSYFLEAERIIRLRGLTKVEKSRKVRLLHHCYAYMRIFHESLSTSSIKSQSRLRIMDVVEKSGVFVDGQDNLSFRLLTWKDLEKQFLKAKSREQGENDLHLANPGLWPATLYPEIFGVPETWMSLLSQVIRLRNEKEMSENTEALDVLSLKEFSMRAKALERCILQWEASASSTMLSTSGQNALQIVDVDWVTLESMLSALRHALAIYYYRTIHDVDPEVLQSKVWKVKDFLFACRQLCQTSGRYLNGLVWPAFIAGCEALDDELQQSFSEWFSLCTQQNGHLSSARMHQVMEKVWEERRQDRRATTSWVRLLQGGIPPS